MLLLTWNTQWCCGLDGIVSPQRIVDTARALGDFDVLCLQEIAVHYPALKGNASGDQPEQLRALLPGYEVLFGPAVDEWNAQGRRQRFGNLIATRLPVLHVQHHPLPYPADPAARSMPRMATVATLLDDDLGPVRVMTTHLEYYSQRQRRAQARALRALNAEYEAHAHAPPQPGDTGSPFQPKVHTANAVLCGDFNLEAHEPPYADLTRGRQPGRWHDAWRLLHGTRTPQPPTFRVYDRRYGPEPITCDFVFVSDGLRGNVRRMAVDTATKASDHQPVLVELR